LCGLLAGCKERTATTAPGGHFSKDAGNTKAVTNPAETASSPQRADDAPNGAISRADWARLVGVAKKDWGSAVDWIEKHVSAKERDPAVARLVAEVCGNDLDRTEEGLSLIRSSELREDTFGLILLPWEKSNPQRLAKYAEMHLKGREKNQAMSAAVHQFCRLKDFEAAAGIAERMPYSDARTSEVGKVALQRMLSDSPSALAWAKGLELPEERNRALTSIVQITGGKGDRKMLESLSGDASMSSFKDDILRRLAGIVAKEDGVKQAVQWLDTIPESAKPSATVSIIGVAMKTDPELATVLALGLKDQRQQDTALSQIVGGLAGSDPKKAADWITRLPKDDMKAEAVSRLTMYWYDTDSIGVSEWINTLPKGLIRDTAVVQLARGLKNTDRQAGVDAAMTISDLKQRQDVLREFGIQQKSQ